MPYEKRSYWKVSYGRCGGVKDTWFRSQFTDYGCFIARTALDSTDSPTTSLKVSCSHVRFGISNCSYMYIPDGRSMVRSFKPAESSRHKHFYRMVPATIPQRNFGAIGMTNSVCYKICVAHSSKNAVQDPKRTGARDLCTCDEVPSRTVRHCRRN